MLNVGGGTARCEVVGVDRDDERVRAVRLRSANRLSCCIVVNAAGPWSSRVNALAGVGGDFTIALHPMRQEVHRVLAPK